MFEWSPDEFPFFEQDNLTLNEVTKSDFNEIGPETNVSAEDERLMHFKEQQKNSEFVRKTLRLFMRVEEVKNVI